MAKYGFLEILDEEMGKSFPFDYEINWDKKNHAVALAFLLRIFTLRKLYFSIIRPSLTLRLRTIWRPFPMSLKRGCHGSFWLISWIS